MESQLSIGFNRLINSWNEYKEAELDWKDGLIDSNYLFDCEWYHNECEQELIYAIEIEIIKEDKNYFD